MKEFLSEEGVKFGYFDISLDFGALKRFLKIRDTHSIYEPVKAQGWVGIPTIIIDDEIIIGLDREELKKKIR
ncbi:glutaredoxin-related protein [Anaerosolibacter carboniphilus]|uniref:Glutaredoxin-related protein n=1 Tax=Anaerosolibacter carboniphilus TaxID=1417629 RepID=A0A841KRC9_9FIRM|nr:glutaredoxin-related protein [Anaerosolibacter carboniphilus]